MRGGTEEPSAAPSSYLLSRIFFLMLRKYWTHQRVNMSIILSCLGYRDYKCPSPTPASPGVLSRLGTGTS